MALTLKKKALGGHRESWNNALPRLRALLADIEAGAKLDDKVTEIIDRYQHNVPDDRGDAFKVSRDDKLVVVAYVSTTDSYEGDYEQAFREIFNMGDVATNSCRQFLRDCQEHGLVE